MDNNADCLRTEHPAEFHKEPHWGTRTISAVVYSVAPPLWSAAGGARVAKETRRAEVLGYKGCRVAFMLVGVGVLES